MLFMVSIQGVFLGWGRLIDGRYKIPLFGPDPRTDGPSSVHLLNAPNLKTVLIINRRKRGFKTVLIAERGNKSEKHQDADSMTVLKCA